MKKQLKLNKNNYKKPILRLPINDFTRQINSNKISVGKLYRIDMKIQERKCIKPLSWLCVKVPSYAKREEEEEEIRLKEPSIKFTHPQPTYHGLKESRSISKKEERSLI